MNAEGRYLWNFVKEEKSTEEPEKEWQRGSRKAGRSVRSWLEQQLRGFPGGGSGKEPACQCRQFKRPRLDPWVRKIP